MNHKIFVVLGYPRTGSNLLLEKLEAYDSFTSLNEFFVDDISLFSLNSLPYDFKLNTDQKKELCDYLGVNVKDDLNLIKKINDNPSDSLYKIRDIIGSNILVKIHIFNFISLRLENLLYDPNVYFILLTRDNKLKTFISLKKALYSQKFDSVNTSKIKIKIDIDEFERYYKKINFEYDRIFKLLTSNDKKYLEVNYEKNLLNFRSDEFYSIFDRWLFVLGYKFSRINPKNNLKKQNLGKCIDHIDNVEEVKNHPIIQKYLYNI